MAPDEQVPESSALVRFGTLPPVEQKSTLKEGLNLTAVVASGIVAAAVLGSGGALAPEAVAGAEGLEALAAEAAGEGDFYPLALRIRRRLSSALGDFANGVNNWLVERGFGQRLGEAELQRLRRQVAATRLGRGPLDLPDLESEEFFDFDEREFEQAMMDSAQNLDNAMEELEQGEIDMVRSRDGGGAPLGSGSGYLRRGRQLIRGVARNIGQGLRNFGRAVASAPATGERIYNRIGDLLERYEPVNRSIP